MEPEITPKSTKNEILDAYHAVLKKMEEQKQASRREEKTRVEKREIVAEAHGNTMESIVKSLAELKLAIGKSLDELESQLLTEARRLGVMRQAFEIENKNLEEIHQIQAEANSLAALIEAQKDKKREFEADVETKAAAFETEMAQKRQQWKKEQEEFERTRKERDDQAKKERAREEEEYAYGIKLTRKKDEDDYASRKNAQEKALEEKRASLEKSWAEREAALAPREQELADLRSRAEAFPGELEKAAKEAEARIVAKLKTEHQFEKQMLSKDSEAACRLKDQMIASLEAKIQNQEELIRQLSRKADEAGVSVQNIALKALDAGAARRPATDGRGDET
jgi:hypothetical protein